MSSSDLFEPGPLRQENRVKRVDPEKLSFANFESKEFFHYRLHYASIPAEESVNLHVELHYEKSEQGRKQG